MASKVRPIPENYHSITPSLVCRDAARAIEFYKEAFGAKEIMRMNGPGGRIMHAEMQIGDSRFMLGEEWPGMSVAPDPSKPQSFQLFVYTENADALFNRAVKAGAKGEMPPQDMFWGDRYGKVQDPFGHQWTLGTHIKDMTQDEMKAAMDQAMAGMRKTA